MPTRGDRVDATAILPVTIGTAISFVALIILAVTTPVNPNSLPAGDVWWFGVALIAFVSGIIGLVFLNRRKARALRAISPASHS